MHILAQQNGVNGIKSLQALFESGELFLAALTTCNAAAGLLCSDSQEGGRNLRARDRETLLSVTAPPLGGPSAALFLQRFSQKLLIDGAAPSEERSGKFHMLRLIRRNRLGSPRMSLGPQSATSPAPASETPPLLRKEDQWGLEITAAWVCWAQNTRQSEERRHPLLAMGSSPHHW